MNRRRFLYFAGASPFALAACGDKTPAAVLAPGKPLPAFELPDLGGRILRPGAGGRPLLLNFWATWCPPCRAEMGGLDILYRRWRGAGLAMFGVSIDDDVNLVREFVLQNRIGFPILLDRSGALAQGLLALRSFPTTVLVGGNGLVTDVIVGERDWNASPAEDAVRSLLG